MEITGYKYTTEAEAQTARQQCANYYGLPVSPDDVTKYWVDYEEASNDSPVFWYIEFDESIRVILGNPTTFEVTFS